MLENLIPLNVYLKINLKGEILIWAKKNIVFSESITFGAFKKLCVIEYVDVQCIFSLSESKLSDDALL
jgi:hypothetical protein